mmetsp:Transcript_41837/g.81805  ORF Transcript_41837/g.81805 Transcript_41837/m.81805 type:complete len:235 (+) Transcript_41837:559-1263(+)
MGWLRFGGMWRSLSSTSPPTVWGSWTWLVLWVRASSLWCATTPCGSSPTLASLRLSAERLLWTWLIISQRASRLLQRLGLVFLLTSKMRLSSHREAGLFKCFQEPQMRPSHRLRRTSEGSRGPQLTSSDLASQHETSATSFHRGCEMQRSTPQSLSSLASRASAAWRRCTALWLLFLRMRWKRYSRSMERLRSSVSSVSASMPCLARSWRMLTRLLVQRTSRVREIALKRSSET